MLDQLIQNFKGYEITVWEVAKSSLSIVAILFAVLNLSWSGIKSIRRHKNHKITIRSKGSEVVVGENLSTEDIKKLLDSFASK